MHRASYTAAESSGFAFPRPQVSRKAVVVRADAGFIGSTTNLVSSGLARRDAALLGTAGVVGHLAQRSAARCSQRRVDSACSTEIFDLAGGRRRAAGRAAGHLHR